MKRIIYCILSIFLVTALCSAAIHKYYVAVFQLEHEPKKKELRMTSRIFIDDLEAAFAKKFGRQFYMADKRELPETGEFIQRYISEKVSIKVNGKVRPVKYLAKEVENDIMVCYFTVPADAKVNTIEIANTTLLDMHPDQQNIINAKINGNKKSLLLTNDERSGILAF